MEQVTSSLTLKTQWDVGAPKSTSTFPLFVWDASLLCCADYSRRLAQNVWLSGSHISEARSRLSEIIRRRRRDEWREEKLLVINMASLSKRDASFISRSDGGGKKKKLPAPFSRLSSLLSLSWHLMEKFLKGPIGRMMNKLLQTPGRGRGFTSSHISTSVKV